MFAKSKIYRISIQMICFFFFVGDTLGSFVYVPCEVIKQRMQVQGTRGSWISSMPKGQNALTNCRPQMLVYYSGLFQAGCSILKEQGLRGLYAG